MTDFIRSVALRLPHMHLSFTSQNLRLSFTRILPSLQLRQANAPPFQSCNMKPSSVRFVPLFGLMALSIVLALVGCVDAYEDPAENEWRSRQANLLWFRTQYRKHYVLDLDRYPEPEERLILKTYPARVTQIAEALQHYGTRSWNSSRYPKVSLLFYLDASPVELT